MSRCAVTGLALDPDHGWALHLDQLTAALRPNTRLVYVNFPHNPTGALPPEEEFRQLVRLCEERGVYLLSDEVYRGLELGGRTALPHAADLSERALSLNVTSKSLGLPGLRIGWITCRDVEVRRRLLNAKHYTTICNSAPSEILARIALKARPQLLEGTRAVLAANLPMFDAFFGEFADLFDWTHPDGGCVAFPRYLGTDGVEQMCHDLVHEAGVLLLPASVFHSELTPTPTDRFRIGFGRADPQAGLDAFAAWLRKRAPRGTAR
ncbi:pyridoxal phosphate-dependent aminotransferase [Lipingzhangella sp. LS1_29]|uniref:Pyridoxal phosphate-dependent aminotransferase n=1 Tax=Lipingzhangella rawalii TaxID=2055835 RepID=A0ABU2H2I3_9ACTN|nr:pyridoxal phosphate-dependent aminotransferase [Lipingzhangella rawalii]MDS1269030.1 pyridoxal phosphate-dependent aminotransferase [Lipingzhangella rawalii]